LTTSSGCRWYYTSEGIWTQSRLGRRCKKFNNTEGKKLKWEKILVTHHQKN